MSLRLINRKIYKIYLIIFNIRFSRYGFLSLDPFFQVSSGDGEIRTLDPLLARQVLSQLSYAPMGISILFSECVRSILCVKNSLIFRFFTLLVGLNGLEPSTSRLSGVRSNQLSYKPS